MPGITANKDPKLPDALVVSEGSDWVAGLQVLGSAADNLVAAIATLCPHDGVSVIPYRRSVVHLDRLAAASPDAARLLLGFDRLLGETWLLPFHELAETYRIQVLKKIEATAEFFFVQRMAVRFLYDDVEIWSAFGYEGASVHLGGYLKRGFDDLDWLPALPNDI